MQEKEIKEVCSICLYGDGKWNAGRNTSGFDNLPVCKLCSADGWTVATSEDVLKDGELSKHISHRIR